MTRRDLKTLAWLLPLATALTVWLRIKVNSCIVHAMVNRWREWFPPTTSIADSPYGLDPCDYWARWYPTSSTRLC